MDRDQAAELFLRAIAEEVLAKSIEVMYQRLQQGGHGTDSRALLFRSFQECHRWFTSLSQPDQEKVRGIIAETAWSFFHSLCYFWDGGALIDLEDIGGAEFVLCLEAYEKETDWLTHQLPAWSMRVTPVNSGWMLQDREWDILNELVRCREWRQYFDIKYDSVASGESISPPKGNPSSVGSPTQVGTYHTLRKLTRGTLLETFHVPSGFAAKSFIPDYQYETAPAILLPVDQCCEMNFQKITDWNEGVEKYKSSDLPGLSEETRCFMREIITEVFEATINEITHLLLNGPSTPSDSGVLCPHDQRLQAIHLWFLRLTKAEREMAQLLVKETAIIALHSFCYFLDGGIHLSAEGAEELEFVAYLEVHSSEDSWLKHYPPFISTKLCPVKGSSWDLREVMWLFIDQRLL